MFYDESKQLSGAAEKWPENRKSNAAKLGDILSEIVESRISPQQGRFQPVAELWEQMLPSELAQHCKIADISRGRLTVQADLPSYANELRWCSPELLEEIQQRCPRAKVKEIKVIVG